MARKTRANAGGVTQPRASAVEISFIEPTAPKPRSKPAALTVDDLTPEMRKTALKYALGDRGRIKVLSRTRFEVA